MARRRGEGWKVNWRGKLVGKAVDNAAIEAINQTMGEAIIYFRGNHPGWENRTGTAEGNTVIIRFAQKISRTVSGVWGSKAVNYMLVLEFRHGSALRNAAAVTYKGLPEKIRSRLK